jgi:lysophospholipase L1-like esterase
VRIGVVAGLAPLASAALALLVGSACDPGPARVLLVGDSITVGRVSEPKAPPYADLLAAALAPDFEVEVAACGGSTASEWMPAADSKLCAREWVEPNLYGAFVSPQLPAEFAVVLLGTNDSGNPHASERMADDYEAALRALVGGLLADGAERIVLMTPPPVHGRMKRYLRLQQLRLRVQAICEDRPEVICGPDLFALLKAEDFETGNAHPNGAGHEKIARALGETLAALAAR